MTWYSELRQKMADREIRWLLERDAPAWIYRIYGEYAIPPLIEAMYSNADWALIKIGKDAVPALIQALKDERAIVRMKVAWVLERIAENGPVSDKVVTAVPALIDALGDEDSYVRSSACNLLVKIEGPAVPALIEALKNEHGEAYAALALGRIGEKIEIDLRAVEKALKDVVDAAKKGSGDAAIMSAKKRSFFRYMEICKAARSHAAKKHSLAGDGVILIGETPKPPGGRNGAYRAGREARALA